MIDDIELHAVQHAVQLTDQNYVRQDIAGLQGTLHQKLGRKSHRVLLSGILVSKSATEDLEKLQEKATSGEEVSFTADITSALSIEKMVIESLRVEQEVGRAGQYFYTVVLAESPPLPPPAEIQSFGGLGEDLGLGDLGFDPEGLTDVLNDIQDQAASVMDNIDAALDVVEQLSSLANLADLENIGNPLKPIADKVGELEDVGKIAGELGGAIGGLIPG